MNKIWLITKREYITRVLNKTFILTTLLTPVAILLFFVAVVLVMSTGSDKTKIIAVIDPSSILDQSFKTRDNLVYNFSNKDLNTLKQDYKDKKIQGIIELPPIKDTLAAAYSYKFYSDEQLALDELTATESGIAKKIRTIKLKSLSVEESFIKKLDTEIITEPNPIFKDKKMSSITALVSSAIGGIVGYAMFFVILFYGMQVMRSVMEEKINRIIEVLISSVKPFQLMMGKVLGVALVGLTQIGIWIILMPIIMWGVTIGFGLNTESIIDINTINTGMQGQMGDSMDKLTQVLAEIRAINWWYLIPIILFYFLMGYLAYSALFAAIGSAVGEDINEANSLTMPIMLPLMFSIYIGFSAVNAPNSSLAVWSSMIPLMSSIVMPVRLPFDPPLWQVLLSMALLVVFTILFVWLASRIYRVGILMYGKKASFKELSKWLFYKG